MNTISIDTGEAVAKAMSPTASKAKFEPYKLVFDGQEGQSILWEKTKDFDFENSKTEAREIAGRLIETLKMYNGLGISGPQCGLDLNVFAFGAEGNYTVLFNPKVLYKSEDSIHLEEGCLSFPFLVLSITRPKAVKVRYQTESGETKDYLFEGISARIVQHEMDHLEGVTFNQRAKPLAMKSGLKKKEKYMKRFVRNIMSQKQLSQ